MTKTLQSSGHGNFEERVAFDLVLIYNSKRTTCPLIGSFAEMDRNPEIHPLKLRKSIWLVGWLVGFGPLRPGNRF